MRPKPTSPACSNESRWESGSDHRQAAGTPVAKLVPLEQAPKKRVFGSAKGDFTVPDDFNES